jgi:radical SAM superfamily enzyme YgiQ (UPF0313 family)
MSFTVGFGFRTAIRERKMSRCARVCPRRDRGKGVNVLLVNGNVSRCAKAGYGPTPAPAGLISLAGALRRRGHRVRLRQAASHVLPQDQDALPRVRKELEAMLAEFTPDLIGLSARNVEAARRPSRPLRLIEYYSAFYDERLVRGFRMVCRAPVVMGGTAYSIEPGLYARHARPDFGLVGEAEETLPALAEAMEARREPAGIPGLVTGPEAPDPHAAGCGRVRDLSVMGVGAFDLVEDFAGQYYEGGGFAPIQTKRGCAMNCIYCTASWLEGQCHRFRPLRDVIEEMKAYRDVWGVKHFFFVDSTFNHPIDHALEVCEALRESGLEAQWFAEVTPAAVNDELAAAMKASGCVAVTLTPDSCSQRVLRSYGKGFGMAEVANAVAVLKRHAIPFDTCLILGGPGETKETLAESLQFCQEHLSDDVVRFYDGMVVTTRSRAYEIAVKEGLIDPAVPYEELVFRNDFRAVKRYEYFFPHVKEGREELLEWIRRACRRRRWLLTSKDYAPDPGTAELALRPEIRVRPGARPWWRGLTREEDDGPRGRP